MFERTRSLTRLVAAAAILFPVSIALADTASFSRTTFDFDEWTFESHSKPYEGSEGGAVLFVPGFHPQFGGCIEARFFTPVPTRLFAIAFLDDATWDPSAGPIESLDVVMTVIELSEGYETNQAGRFYMEQGGRYFRYGGFSHQLEEVYTHIANGLMASDFHEVFFDTDAPVDPSSNPNFSQDGQPIRIGFGQDWLFFDFTLGVNLKWGYDNYGVTIHYSEPVEPVCPGDANGDLQVDLADLNILLAHFGQDVPIGTNGDLVPDGMVDLVDLNRLLALFGTVCD